MRDVSLGTSHGSLYVDGKTKMVGSFTCMMSGGTRAPQRVCHSLVAHVCIMKDLNEVCQVMRWERHY